MKCVQQIECNILPDITGKEHSDRLPVLVSGDGCRQILGIPKIPSATGRNQPLAVETCLKKWAIDDKIQAMSFDSTTQDTIVEHVSFWNNWCKRILFIWHADTTLWNS